MTTKFPTDAGSHRDQCQDICHSDAPPDDPSAWSFDLGDELPDLTGLDSDDEDGDEAEFVEMEEIRTEDALNEWKDFMEKAQNAARDAERERERSLKRKTPTFYPKNSMKTQKRHAQAAETLRKEGFLSVFDFMKAKRAQKSGTEGLELENDKLDDETQIRIEQQTIIDESPLEEITQNEEKAPEHVPACLSDTNEAHVKLKQMLESFRALDDTFEDENLENESDRILNQFNFKDFPALRRARASLTVKSKDTKLNVVFRGRINGMVGVLNLYLDPELAYSWRKASCIVARSFGHGSFHARNLRVWIHQYLRTKTLPLHRYGRWNSSILDDEDLAQAIQLHLLTITKDGYICAQDVVRFVASPEIQKRLQDLGKKKKSISVRTACRWLKTLDWRYGRKQNGMYVDGHERDDVKEYRKGLANRWIHEYEPRMKVYDNDGKLVRLPQGFPLPAKYCGQAFQLILVTHDESTFYANDRRKVKYYHPSQKSNPQPKGEGQSIMVSDFQTVEWGRLVDGDDEARIIFKARKQREGWFTSEDLLAQVDHAIDIFEGKTNGFATGLWMFDNAPSHQKCASDALSAHKMPKRPHESWTPHPGGPHMRNGTFNGQTQELYYPEDHPTMPGWFKGMETIIWERGLWPEDGLLAQCEGFKCESGSTDCCCRRLLFTQPDFISQKSQLEELITSRGHICDFYPKYHCECNFIEMYWGAAKYRYRSSPRTSNIDEMEKNMLACLDDVPHLQIIRYANRSARFISAYYHGLTGADAVWASKKYAGHRILPPDILADIRKFVEEQEKQKTKPRKARK